MANVGIEFTMKDGSKESFDPVNFEDDFKETSEAYDFENSAGYKYSMKKDEVESFRTYELCHHCGYEVSEDGFCQKCVDDIDNSLRLL